VAITACLERDVLHVHRCHLHDLSTGRGAAGERDFVDIEVRSYSSAAVLAVAVQNIHDTGWESSFFDESREIEDREGVCSAALMTTVLPHARAGPSFHAAIARG
jgi:hypothetical protein